MATMLLRRPVLAGRFYDADPTRLAAQIRHFMANGAGQTQARPASHGGKPWGLMLPHAGHVYCGMVVGATLNDAPLPQTLVIICPNHTGRGRQALGVWPNGVWLTPLGPVAVNTKLASELAALPPFGEDAECHGSEHSIEVLLPFFQEYARMLAEQAGTPDAGASGADTSKAGAPAVAVPNIVPVCVGTQNYAVLTQAGQALAGLLSSQPAGSVGVIVSSDMNHFADVETTKRKDRLALDKVVAGDPLEFLKTIQGEKISMCGAGLMALALTAMHALGKPVVEEVCHDTSATASGDTARVVGYAGLRLFVD